MSAAFIRLFCVLQVRTSRLRTSQSCSELYERYCGIDQRKEKEDGEHGKVSGMAGIRARLGGESSII